jgi:hypothetical protein
MQDLGGLARDIDTNPIPGNQGNLWHVPSISDINGRG